jgi:hypothetical protein
MSPGSWHWRCSFLGELSLVFAVKLCGSITPPSHLLLPLQKLRKACMYIVLYSWDIPTISPELVDFSRTMRCAFEALPGQSLYSPSFSLLKYVALCPLMSLYICWTGRIRRSSSNRLARNFLYLCSTVSCFVTLASVISPDSENLEYLRNSDRTVGTKIPGSFSNHSCVGIAS